MNSTRIRVGIVEEHLLLLQALKKCLHESGAIDVVATACDVESGIAALSQARPDVVILDGELPDHGAREIVQGLTSQGLDLKLIIVSAALSHTLLDLAMRFNAAGYLLKSEPLEVLVRAVQSAMDGRIEYSARVRELLEFNPSENRYKLHAPHGLSQMTPRQIEVLRRLAMGESVKEVARHMQLSQKSVDSHKYRIMSKLGIHDRVELARFAIREGLLNP